MKRFLAGVAIAAVSTSGVVLTGAVPAAGSAIAPAARSTERATQRYNIILITAEDLSPRFGSFGDAVARTPRIDALAREGIRFTNVFAAAAVCAPSRSALITGVHPQTLGTMHMRTSSFGKDMDHGAPYEAVPPATVKAFPELLRAAGYYTVNRAKTDYQFGEPFTVWDENSESADWNRRRADQPFFAMINFGETHESRTWPPETKGSHPAIPGVMKQNARIDAEKAFPKTDPASVVVPPYYPDTPVVRANIARHYDNVRLMDGKVGVLLDQLRREGRFEDSVIIFMTDHGDGLPRGKRSLYDSGLHVPMIVRFPDKRGAGTTREDLVSFVDIAPTLLSLAGASPPRWIQGRPIFNPKSKAPSYVYAAADRFDEVTQRRKFVRSERFAYVRNYLTNQAILPSLVYQNVNPVMAEMRRLDAEGKLNRLQRSYLHAPAPREELYDSRSDPHQVRNLAFDPTYRRELIRLRKAMDKWVAASGDLSALPESAMVEQMWPGGKQPQTAAPQACRSGTTIKLASPTNGASIGWRGPDGAWRLYTGAVSLPAEAKAIRYGFKESSIIRIDGPASVRPCR